LGSLAIGGVVFACTFGAALFGMILRATLPDHHLSNDSKDVVKLGTGLIATLTALVLGLLIASAKSSFDAQRSGFQQMSANLVILDRRLAEYGPEAEQAREALHRLVASAVDRIWPESGSQSSRLHDPQITTDGGLVLDRIRELAPKNEGQRWLQSQALQISADLAHTRWLLNEEEASAIPTPFLIVVVFWLSVIFVSFGLFAPPNATVVAVLLICALSVGGAMFLIVDLDQPFKGLFRISGTSLHHALSQMGQ
jgi:hypothetical protein